MKNEFGVMIQITKGMNFVEKFKEAQQLGLSSCQLSFWDMDFYNEKTKQEIKQALKETGFKVSLIWAGWTGPIEWSFIRGPITLGLVPKRYRQMRLKQLKLASDFALDLGVTDIATHVGFLPENMTDKNYAEIVSTLREFCGFLRDRGQNFLFETGQETPITLLRTIQDIGLDNVFINFDTANLILYGKGNSVDAVRVFGKYIRNTHIKDGFYPTNGKELGAEVKVGEGLANFPELIPMLRKAGYQGPLTIEREIWGEEQKRDIRDTVVYLHNILESFQDE